MNMDSIVSPATYQITNANPSHPHPHRHQQTNQVTGKLLDIVGTGGDGAHTINISTAAIVLAAACGAKAAKLGNRSVSSKCGTWRAF